MKYYTYTHSNLDGTIFYVGKGTGARAYAKYDRSKEWKNYVTGLDGIIIKIIKRFETDDEAFANEIEIIKNLKDSGIKLINKTYGGRGLKGYQLSDELKAQKSKQMLGYKHESITCPVCGIIGGATSMKRWHFDKCTGRKPIHKARVSKDGIRIFLGKYHTYDEATEVIKNFYIENNIKFPKEFIARRKGLNVIN